MDAPSIACVGVIGKLVCVVLCRFLDVIVANNCFWQNNPLQISVFPPHEGSRFSFHLFLNSCLDIFAIRQQHVSVDQDLGLLHAFDERFAAYGWLTNTGVKFVVIVDMMGKNASGSTEDSANTIPLPGVRGADLKPASIH